MGPLKPLAFALVSLGALSCRSEGPRPIETTPNAAIPVAAAPIVKSEEPAPDAREALPARSCVPARAPIPVDADDPLFYVNRTHAIPSEYPLSSTSVWTPCSWDPAPSAKKHDFICLPAPYVFHAREALRRFAFESDAPAGMAETHDGLAVGREGKIGFKPLFDAARESGFELFVRSGFRPYATQGATFAMWVAQELGRGRSREDALRRVTRFSARAGHSEHQLGTTVDLVYKAENGVVYDGWNAETIAASAAIRWVKANAHRFGVVLTYDEGREEVTQYVWEPWHWRFVGVEAADAMHACGISTEEYLQARYGEEPEAFSPHSGRNARR